MLDIVSCVSVDVLEDEIGDGLMSGKCAFPFLGYDFDVNALQISWQSGAYTSDLDLFEHRLARVRQCFAASPATTSFLGVHFDAAKGVKRCNGDINPGSPSRGAGCS